MKSIIRLLTTRFRVLLFFVWVLASMELLQNGRYLTFLRPEFGVIIVAALVFFLALVTAEMARDPDDHLHWYEFQRPLILLVPLLFLVNAQGTSLDYYTFNKRFTGTAAMAVDVEPSKSDPASQTGKPAISNSGVPSSLNPSPDDRVRFNRRWDSTDSPDNQAGNATKDPGNPDTRNEKSKQAGAEQTKASVTTDQSADKGLDDDEGVPDGVLEPTAVELYETPKLYEGKTVAVIGMVDTNEDVIRQFNDRSKVLFRFLITCCAADATPIALVFQTKQRVSVQGENVWVRVVGTFTLIKKDGRTIPVIQDATMATIPRPRNEYLY